MFSFLKIKLIIFLFLFYRIIFAVIHSLYFCLGMASITLYKNIKDKLILLKFPSKDEEIGFDLNES